MIATLIIIGILLIAMAYGIISDIRAYNARMTEYKQDITALEHDTILTSEWYFDSVTRACKRAIKID